MNVHSTTADVDTPKKHRVDTVDFARGIAAVAVMVYHLLYSEEIGTYSQVGFYCVYAFFVISGFSLYISYVDKLSSVSAIQHYAIKRVRRIAPLFYAACLLQALLVYAPSWDRVLLNLSLMFGFANPGVESMVMGGWSIGIEIVFYLMFPFIIILTKRSLLLLGFLTGFSILIMVGFVNTTLAGHLAMKEVWPSYTQPMAFFGYFAFGCLLGEVYLRHHGVLKGRRLSVFLLGIALIPFFLFRANNPTDYLKGSPGLLLMGSTMLVVAATAFTKEPEGVLHQFAKWAGKLSYPIYLLHPIIYLGVVRDLGNGAVTRIAITIVLTTALSVVVHEKIEKRFHADRNMR